VACRYTVYGCQVEPACLAFSSPTEKGMAFAAAFTSRPDFLVYFD
jgi:hypothetical protein